MFKKFGAKPILMPNAGFMILKNIVTEILRIYG